MKPLGAYKLTCCFFIPSAVGHIIKRCRQSCSFFSVQQKHDPCQPCFCVSSVSVILFRKFKYYETKERKKKKYTHSSLFDNSIIQQNINCNLMYLSVFYCNFKTFSNSLKTNSRFLKMVSIEHSISYAMVSHFL